MTTAFFTELSKTIIFKEGTPVAQEKVIVIDESKTFSSTTVSEETRNFCACEFHSRSTQFPIAVIEVVVLTSCLNFYFSALTLFRYSSAFEENKATFPNFSIK